MTTSNFGGRTFGQILNENRGVGPGFDLLRLLLAVSILLSHASMMAGNHHLLSTIIDSLFHSHAAVATVDPTHIAAAASPDIDLATMGRSATGPGRPYTLSRVPMFFALSGFLVAASAFRTRSVVRFLGLRALRIFPALAMEVALSALLLGAIFTTLPLSEYFGSPQLYRYFGNILGLVDMSLPGVFKDTSPSQAINGNLWTLPAEFYCYVTLSIAMIVGVLYSKKVFSIIFLAMTAVLIVANSGFGFLALEDVLSEPVIFYYFAMGVFVFQWRDKVPYNPLVFVAALTVFLALSYSHRTIFIYPIALVYVTIFVGLSPIPKLPLIGTGDYSYGIYLYGYPITQALIAGVPSIRGNLVLIAPISLVCTCLFATLSWHIVEKNALKLKKYIAPRSAALTSQMHPGATASQVEPGQSQVQSA